MNHRTKSTVLPGFTAYMLRDNNCLIDNLFADLWKQMGIKSLLNKLGFSKCSGTHPSEIVFALMI